MLNGASHPNKPAVTSPNGVSALPSTFASLGVPDRLVACLNGLGVTEPYPVQIAAIPDSLAARDLLVQSPAGSGKTLAFAIPLVTRLEKARRSHPRALILAPTRELAAQIAETIRPLARTCNLKVAAFYGGAGYRGQLNALDRGVDIVVGCPGRLIDLLERRVLSLTDVRVAVIDEADRMADMGFLPAVRRLLNEVSGEHQTVMFSATLTKDVELLVRDYQHDPKRLLLERPSDDIGSRTHEFWKTSREDRTRLTIELVAGHPSSIVFCRTKRGVDRLARQLAQAGVPAAAIHGDRSQAQRERALDQFRNRRVRVLVGTDVASRGIHIDDVDCVVHYDPPEDSETYVHRSGRTGRAGASGRVVSLVCSDQWNSSRRLAKDLSLEARFEAPEKSEVQDRRYDRDKPERTTTDKAKRVYAPKGFERKPRQSKATRSEPENRKERSEPAKRQARRGGHFARSAGGSRSSARSKRVRDAS